MRVRAAQTSGWSSTAEGNDQGEAKEFGSHVSGDDVRIGQGSERCDKIPWGCAPRQSPTLRCGGPESILGGMLLLFCRIRQRVWERSAYSIHDYNRTERVPISGFNPANYLVELNLHFHAWPPSLSISQTLALLLIHLVSPYHLLRSVFLSFLPPFSVTLTPPCPHSILRAPHPHP